MQLVKHAQRSLLAGDGEHFAPSLNCLTGEVIIRRFTVFLRREHIISANGLRVAASVPR
jgi:hypothetical protein